VSREPLEEDDLEPRPAPRTRRATPSEPPRRGRRALRWLGALALVGALAAFVVSFVSGLGGDAEERVTGDAQQGGAQLDRMGPRLRVEVLNAGGVAGVARRATEHLRDRGFDVVYMGNAGSFEQDSTVVVARTADVDAARRVAEALGTDSVTLEPDPQLYVDATVLLGKNWPRAETAREPERGVFARLRSWLSSE